ncbi:MAG: DUF1566 domain-containing protein [Methylococcaceae bacterium]|nr:DUF1566 domain-containing protein [Methylococcaceae bacterium]
MRKLNIRFFLLMLVFWMGWSGAANATYAISVDKIGTGLGTVSSTNDGDARSQDINCGTTTCAGTFPQTYDYLYSNSNATTLRDVNVSLTAIPSIGSVFKGWFLNDGVTPWPNCGTRIACSVTATIADQQITAKFDIGAAPTVPFTVINAGSGSDYGRIVSSEKSSTSPTLAAIDCKGVKFDGGNTDCSENFESGRSVTLNAGVKLGADGKPVQGAFFGGWEVYFDGNNLGFGRQTNLCLGIEPTCNITVPPTVKDIQVRAIFNLGYILTLQRQGEGAGSLLASSDNLQTTCLDSSCQQTYNADRVVKVTAISTSTSKIVSWTVDGVPNASCADAALTCTVTMDKAHLVSAKFDKVLSGSFTATLLKEGSGTGFGTVTGTVVKTATKIIDCGTKCSESVNQSDSVRFEAKPDKTGVNFAGWKVYYWDPIDLKWVNKPDACTGLQPVCEVTVTQNVQVNARFDYDIILTVVRDGNGVGSVISSSPALNKCTVDSPKTICEQTFVEGQVVSLTAVAELKSRFVKWNGCASTSDGNQDGSQEICNVTMNQAELVTATFESINSAALSVTKDPSSTGKGTVKSDLLGLNCGSICNRNYSFNTVVTLTATPSPGSEFVGWGGDWCSGLELTCKVTMDQAKDVTARFDAGFKLTLNKQGEGEGAVFSDPAGINCGSTCGYSFTNATVVELTAKPVNGSTFLGWGGPCTGTSLTCIVAMTQAQEVTVTFSGVGLAKALDNAELIWTTSGDAPWFGQQQKDAKVKTVYFAGSAGVSGLITHGQESSVETLVTGPRELSFNWKVSSEENHDELRFELDGQVIQKISGEQDWKEVKGTIPEGLHVLKWTYAKDADLSAGADTAWLDKVQMSVATGDVVPNKLTISNQGSGLGSVTSNPSGISCGGACSAEFANNTAVLLRAEPLGGSQFVGWSGACSGTAPCLVTVNGIKTVVAIFNTIGDMATTAALHLGLLNDTGVDWCANKSTQYLSNKDSQCELLMATFPGQDGQVGRDNAARKGKLSKMGSGEAGFDYTKLCNNGQAEGSSGCPADQTVAGEGASQWGCTRDNVTGLIWEVKTTTGLRDKVKVYSWYDANDRHNGGSKGDSCTGLECNTDAFVKAVNQQGLCGANDWRLPTRRELHSMVHHGRSNPAVDISSFPNTVADGYWTATPVASTPFNAWIVNFELGWDFWYSKATKQHVRLVRKCEDCELATAITTTNPSYSNSLLHLPQVKVESEFYDATLRLVSANPMIFEVSDAQAKKTAVARSVNGDQVRYFLTGLLVVGNVEVGAERYNATLQLIPGSNPMRFKLLDAYVVK